MRLLSINLLATLLLALSVSPASAFEVRMSARNSTGPLNPGDTVTIDVFFDATAPDIILFSVGLIFDPTFLEYQFDASAALPIIHPAPLPAYGTTGAEPGYILYDPPVAGMPPIPAVSLLPLQTPAWFTWPNPEPGQAQVNVNYFESNILDTFNTRTTGNNIWIGSMVLRVRDDAPNGDSMVNLCMTCAGNLLQLGEVVQPPPPVTGAVTVTVPEPAAMALGAAAVLSLSFYAVRARRRRS